MRWVAALSEHTEGDIVSIDGKALRKSFDKASSKSAIYMVSAFSAANELVLGQLKTKDKSNEITAVPKLLECLILEGAIVTMEALNCQKEIAAKFIEKKTDYVLALKGNHHALYDDVSLYFKTHLPYCKSTEREIEKGHGRIEIHRYWMTDKIEWLSQKPEWCNLNAIGMVKTIY